jgi:hypothetical protein
MISFTPSSPFELHPISRDTCRQKKALEPWNMGLCVKRLGIYHLARYDVLDFPYQPESEIAHSATQGHGCLILTEARLFLRIHRLARDRILTYLSMTNRLFGEMHEVSSKSECPEGDAVVRRSSK